MSEPSESPYLGAVLQSSKRVVAFEDPDFESSGINVSDDQPLLDAHPLSVTVAFMLPGQIGPKLRKTQFRNQDTSGLPIQAVEGLEDHFAEQVNGMFASMGNDGMRDAARWMSEACDEVGETVSISVPFKVVAVQAIYSYSTRADARPTIYGVNFTATDFADALEEEIPPTPSVDEMSEEDLRDMHAAEAEQVEGTEPYPEWRQLARKALYRNVPDSKRKQARAMAGLLVLPQAATHPTIERLLFQDQAV